MLWIFHEMTKNCGLYSDIGLSQIRYCLGRVRLLSQTVALFIFLKSFCLFTFFLSNQIGSFSRTKRLCLWYFVSAKGQPLCLPQSSTWWIFISLCSVLSTESQAGRQFLHPPAFLSLLSWFLLAWLRDWPWVTSLILSTGMFLEPQTLRAGRNF